MESDRIYEESKEEINRILKSLGSDSVVINLNKLDTQTKGELIESIRNTIYERRSAIDSVILGVK